MVHERQAELFTVHEVTPILSPLSQQGIDKPNTYTQHNATLDSGFRLLQPMKRERDRETQKVETERERDSVSV